MSGVHVDACVYVCVWGCLILWVSMMRSDSLFQNNVAEEAQAILNFTRNHISHTWVLEKNTHTHTNLDIVLLCLQLGLTVVLDLHHTHTHTHSLPSNGTRDAGIVCPTFSRSLSLSLIHVFHPDRCQRLVNQAADWWLEWAEWTHGLVPIWGHVRVCLSVGEEDFNNCDFG